MTARIKLAVKVAFASIRSIMVGCSVHQGIRNTRGAEKRFELEVNKSRGGKVERLVNITYDYEKDSLRI